MRTAGTIYVYVSCTLAGDIRQGPTVTAFKRRSKSMKAVPFYIFLPLKFCVLACITMVIYKTMEIVMFLVYACSHIIYSDETPAGGR